MNETELEADAAERRVIADLDEIARRRRVAKQALPLPVMAALIAAVAAGTALVYGAERQARRRRRRRLARNVARALHLRR